MLCWQEDQLIALQTTRSEREFFESLIAIARNLGFEYCAYGARLAFPIVKPRFILSNNYPSGWQTRYRERNYLAIDPTVRHGISSFLSIVWSDMLFASERAFWEEARSFGLRFGWAQSNRDCSGATGMLTLARSTEALSEAELEAKGLQMSWLSQVAHLGMSGRLASMSMLRREVRLTPREKTVLGWTAEGKTSGEIATILGVSERVVHFHIRNAARKLEATNKVAAAVRAALLGLL